MSTQHSRFHSSLSNICHPTTIRLSPNGAPSVYLQAADLGGVFSRISRGLPYRSVANFSPSLIKHKGHDLIAFRSQPEPFCFRWDMKYFYYNSTPTEVYVGELLNDETIVGAKNIRERKHRLSYEDPRLFIDAEDNLMCQFVTSSYASRWDSSKHKMIKSPKVCVGSFDDFGNCIDAFYPPIGINHQDGGSEKNWCFFADGDVTRLLYSTQPIVIKTPGEEQKVIDASVLKNCTGEHPTFNSTAPVKVGDEWLVFYHYKLMGIVRGEPRPVLFYMLSAYTLDENLTKIVRYMPEAIFTGSLDDELITWTDYQGQPISKQPACILPFGCVADENEIALSLGVNDSFMGIFRCPTNNILSLMTKV